MPTDTLALIIELYKGGMSCQEIVDSHNFGMGVRKMQKLLKAHGVIRSQPESFRNAVQRGRVNYKKKGWNNAPTT